MSALSRYGSPTETKKEEKIMHYLFVKHKVVDFARWSQIFQGHAEAQRQAGLELLHLLRDVADPNLVMMLFSAHDPEKAMAFTRAPAASEAAQSSGVIGVPEILFLTDS